MSYDLIAMGCSWGGLRALGHIIESLPADLPAAVVVAQHRSARAPTEALISSLSGRSRLSICDIEDKDPVEPGRIYVAPSDYHVLVEPGYFSLSTDELVQFARPSVDVLFESAADAYGSRLIAVVLTGLNEDGADGVRRVEEAGGLVIAQHPDSAEKSEMPLAAIATGAVDEILPLGDIGAFLARVCFDGADTSVGRDV